MKKGYKGLEKDQIDLLWTGGWDSTFRLLFLLLVEKKRVQTHYIIDESRPSFEFEMKAMSTIKDALIEQYPFTKDLILPTEIVQLSQIKPNKALWDMWWQLETKYEIGVQYGWIPRYADEKGLHDLEFCWEKRDVTGDFLKKYQNRFVGEGHNCRAQYNSLEDEVSIFRYFCFPTLHLSKIDMEKIAKEKGFLDILKMTWFCHTPNKNGQPCETCVPCTVARKSGHSHGLPKTNFVRDLYIKTVTKLNNYARRIQRKIFNVT